MIIQNPLFWNVQFLSTVVILLGHPLVPGSLAAFLNSSNHCSFSYSMSAISKLPNISENTWCLCCCVWSVCFNLMASKYIHVVENDTHTHTQKWSVCAHKTSQGLLTRDPDVPHLVPGWVDVQLALSFTLTYSLGLFWDSVPVWHNPARVLVARAMPADRVSRPAAVPCKVS